MTVDGEMTDGEALSKIAQVYSADTAAFIAEAIHERN